MKHKSKKKKTISIAMLKRQYATKLTKFKAFLIDNFMLLMPIMYVVFYLIMGGRSGFAEHKIYGWIAIFLPLILLQAIFFIEGGKLPDIRLIILN